MLSDLGFPPQETGFSLCVFFIGSYYLPINEVLQAEATLLLPPTPAHNSEEILSSCSLQTSGMSQNHHLS